ncbi:MAG: ATP-binding cassette domain-containing protein [Lachnospiraceae bacterium]|nr:ATP-binding cassette domain-containing protein [Lachnospiraceae bacterium]
MEQELAVTVQNVKKEFKNQTVLKDINIDFQMGKIYGIIGRNGSGKTVLLKCICGLLYPSSGVVKVNQKIVGRDIDFPQNIGFIIENPGFLHHYSGLKNLKYLASIRGKVKEEGIRKYMQLVGLNPDDKKPVGKYSLGMRQRLGIAQALMEEPDILILDEPMNALDNAGVEEMRNVFVKMKEQGKLIIIASHIRDDIDILCDEVYGIDVGVIKKIR